ncbi:MAG: type II secretion system protein [Rickettsiales bacterium]
MASQRRGGFSLTELSISLAIIGVIAGSAMSVLLTGDYQAKRKQTELKMDRIRDALAAFVVTYKRLPCPAKPDVRRDAAGFGEEIGPSASDPSALCNDGSGVLYRNGDGVFVGTVPVATLGLPYDYVQDGWDGRYLYVLDAHYAVSPKENPACSAAAKTPPCLALGSGTTGITVRGAGGALKNDMATYALISFGENGHGAYPGFGGNQRINGYPEDSPYHLAGSDELENAELTADGTDAYKTMAFDAVIVQKPFVDKREAANPDDREYFDDVVLFRTKRQLLADAAGDGDAFTVSPKLYDVNCLYAAEALENPTSNRCTGAADEEACQKFAAELEERCL